MAAGQGEQAAGGDLVVPPHSRRREQVAQQLQHAIPIVCLPTVGVQALDAGARAQERLAP